MLFAGILKVSGLPVFTGIFKTVKLFQAWEIQEVFPELVSENGDEKLLAVNYTSLIPVLVKAIQEQQKEIDGLNNLLFPFKIFKGIESDILNDGSLDLRKRL